MEKNELGNQWLQHDDIKRLAQQEAYKDKIQIADIEVQAVGNEKEVKYLSIADALNQKSNKPILIPILLNETELENSNSHWTTMVIAPEEEGNANRKVFFYNSLPGKDQYYHEHQTGVIQEITQYFQDNGVTLDIHNLNDVGQNKSHQKDTKACGTHVLEAAAVIADNIDKSDDEIFQAIDRNVNNKNIEELHQKYVHELTQQAGAARQAAKDEQVEKQEEKKELAEEIHQQQKEELGEVKERQSTEVDDIEKTIEKSLHKLSDDLQKEAEAIERFLSFDEESLEAKSAKKPEVEKAKNGVRVDKYKSGVSLQFKDHQLVGIDYTGQDKDKEYKMLIPIYTKDGKDTGKDMMIVIKDGKIIDCDKTKDAMEKNFQDDDRLQNPISTEMQAKMQWKERTYVESHSIDIEKVKKETKAIDNNQLIPSAVPTNTQSKAAEVQKAV